MPSLTLRPREAKGDYDHEKAHTLTLRREWNELAQGGTGEWKTESGKSCYNT